MSITGNREFTCPDPDGYLFHVEIGDGQRRHTHRDATCKVVGYQFGLLIVLSHPRPHESSLCLGEATTHQGDIRQDIFAVRGLRQVDQARLKLERHRCLTGHEVGLNGFKQPPICYGTGFGHSCRLTKAVGRGFETARIELLTRNSLKVVCQRHVDTESRGQPVLEASRPKRHLAGSLVQFGPLGGRERAIDRSVDEGMGEHEFTSS